MKKSILFLSFLLSCLVGMAGNMDKYTITPASGLSLTQDDLKHVTISFPDANGLRESDFAVYVYLNEDTEHTLWETLISLEAGSKLKFEGNDVIMDISEIADKYSGDLYFVINENYLKSQSYDYAPRIQWMYHLASSFDGMIASPANGATVSPSDFNKLTLTFPNITDLKMNESRMYCGFDLHTVDGDEWIGGGNLHDVATISGNSLSFDIKQEWKPAKACKIKVNISKDALVDGSTNKNSSAITLIYDIATKQYECIVEPSNAEALPITAFHDLTFTFKDAQKVEIPTFISSFDEKKVHLRKYTRDGYEEYGFYNADDVTVEDNVVKIYMRVTALKGATLTLIADEGAFIIDGNPSQEIKMEYEFLPFETEFDVKCEEKLDSEDRLYVILPSGLKLQAVSTQGLVSLKNSEDLPNGFYVFADCSTDDNTAWFTFESPKGDILADGEYHFTLHNKAIVMFTEDDIMVESRSTEIYFKKDSTAGIHDVRIVADGKIFTLDGRPATADTKGIVIKNGKKVMNK